jgi:large subunit ribosomal protein L21
MKAVITVGGKQYIVAEKETLLVDKLPEEQQELTLDALLTFDGKSATVGTPTVKNAKVVAKVVDPLVKGDKVRAIRFEAKKRVNKIRGMRHQYSRIEIVSIK